MIMSTMIVVYIANFNVSTSQWFGMTRPRIY